MLYEVITSLVIRERAPILRHLAQRHIHRFDGVGRVNRLTNLGWI